MQLDKEERRFFLLAALLLPLRLCSAPGAKGKPQPVSTHIVREAVKWRAKDAEMTVLLHETVGACGHACMLVWKNAWLLQGNGGPTKPRSSCVMHDEATAHNTLVSAHAHAQASELLGVYKGLTEAGSEAAAPDAVKVAMGNAIRKLKQHWRLGEPRAAWACACCACLHAGKA